MELKDIKPQGSQLKTVRKQMNIVKGWVLHEADLQFIKKMKAEHPVEFFRGVIQCLPKDVDMGDEMKEWARTFFIRAEKEEKVIDAEVVDGNSERKIA